MGVSVRGDQRQEGAGATIGDRVAARGGLPERVHAEPVDPGLVGAELVGGDPDRVGSRRPPGASSGMVSKVPGAVIRSPTDSSTPRVLSKSRSAVVVMGSAPMKVCTLTNDQISSLVLVTQPLTRTLPWRGIEEGSACRS